MLVQVLSLWVDMQNSYWLEQEICTHLKAIFYDLVLLLFKVFFLLIRHCYLGEAVAGLTSYENIDLFAELDATQLESTEIQELLWLLVSGSAQTEF